MNHTAPVTSISIGRRRVAKGWLLVLWMIAVSAAPLLPAEPSGVASCCRGAHGSCCRRHQKESGTGITAGRCAGTCLAGIVSGREVSPHVPASIVQRVMATRQRFSGAPETAFGNSACPATRFQRPPPIR